MGDILDGMWQDGRLDILNEEDEACEYGGAQPRDRYIGRFKCRHCAAPDLYWQRSMGRWLPFSRETLRQHVCARPDERNDEGFDDVD